MKLTIRQKLFAGFATMLVLMAAIGFYGWRQTRALSGEVDAIYENNLKAAVHLANAQDALWRLRYGFPQFLALTSPEDRKKIVDDEPKHYAVIAEQVKAYETGERTSEEREAIKEWNEVSQKYFGSRPKWFELVGAGRMEEAAAWRAAGPTPFGAGSVKALGKLIELQRKVAQQGHAEALATARSATAILTVLVCVGLGVGLGLAYVINRGISHPLRQTVEMLKDIAEGEGDLTKRLQVRSTDELGEVAHWFKPSSERCTTSWSRCVRPRPTRGRRRNSSRGRRGNCPRERRSRRRAWRRRRPRSRRSPAR